MSVSVDTRFPFPPPHSPPLHSSYLNFHVHSITCTHAGAKIHIFFYYLFSTTLSRILHYHFPFPPPLSGIILESANALYFLSQTTSDFCHFWHRQTVSRTLPLNCKAFTEFDFKGFFFEMKWKLVIICLLIW